MTQDVSKPSAAEQPAVQPAAPPILSPTNPYVWGVGRRKKSVARVRIRPGTGKFQVNKLELEQFFKAPRDRAAARSALELTKMTTWDVFVSVAGGGTTGQAGAVKLGVARALLKASPDLLPTMREYSLLTRDARMKERKKYGQKGARKRFQFSKR